MLRKLNDTSRKEERNMQPPSYEEFIRNQQESMVAERNPEKEKFLIETCPTPGCRCGRVRPRWRDGKIAGFSCDFGCVFTAQRNAFNGNIMYFRLDRFDVMRFRDSSGFKGMKFKPDGEIYADWF